MVFLLLTLITTFYTSRSVATEPLPETLVAVKTTVARLDSAVNSLYGWEPQDSTYNHAVDTVVNEIVNQYNEDKEDNYIARSASEPAISQNAYNQARSTWSEFKQLIDADKYEEALEFYFSDSPDGEGKREGDFLLFLKHSTYRYTFDSEVLLPLMRELRGDTFAVDHYIDILQLEKVLEDAGMAMNQSEEPYIPEVYPYVVTDLGFALSAAGKMEEALNLSGDLMSAIYDMSDSAIQANFTGTQYVAQLHVLTGNLDGAIAIWEKFEQYLEEYKSDYSEEELQDAAAHIEMEKRKLLYQE